ncbi:cohesin domain-containing protein [Solimicrobium silvestre]|nr:cohesin domain-containing protein [Solimicrobium silvestre]
MQKRFILCSGIIVSILLAGCAGQLAYRDGKNLVEEGKMDEGLSKFKEALANDPHDAKYREAYLQTRERSLYRYLEQADLLVNNGSLDEAKNVYQHALIIVPGNEKALAGLMAIDSAQRQTQLLNAADADFAKKDLESARKKVAEVLIDNAKNTRAIALKKAIDEKVALFSADTQLAKTFQKKITIEFKDVALKQVFEVISRTSGLNFLFDKEVKTDQRTSIFLKNSSIESAIHFTLMTNQLDKQVLDSNTILIYPNTPAKQKEYQELVVRTFFLTNAEAKNVANTLKTIIKSHDIVVDDKLNMIIVRDSPDAIKLAEKLVALQDVAEPEVMLEVEVLEVQRTFLQNLGIQWPASLGLTPQPLSVLQSSTGSTSSTSTSGLSLNDLLHQSKNTLGASIGATTINANLQDSDAKLLTNPRIRVRNHEKAKILIGERVPNITSTATSTGFVSQSINYIDIGLTLNVEPTIYLDDNVGIKVSLEVSSILNQITTQSGTNAYEIGTRTASTVLRLKNGETDVLAGLIDNQERTSGNKIPGVGSMPILGRLFGSTTNNDQNTEIVLSITPHLIRNIQRPDANDAYFLSGTESSLHTRAIASDNSENTPISTPAATTLAKPMAQRPTPPHSPNGLNALTNSESATSPTSASSDLGAGTPMGSGDTPAGAGSINAAGAGAPAAGGVANGVSQVQFNWQSPNQVAAGGTVAVALMMQSSQPISSIPLTLGFDSTKLQVIGVSEGTYLKQGAAPTNFTSRINPNGQIALSDSTSNSSGITNTAVLATVTFRALSVAGPTTIQVLSATPVGAGNTPIPVAIPTPFVLQVTP